MNDIEHLHQLVLTLAARLQATEAIANAAVAMLCAEIDGNRSVKDKFLTETFPSLLLGAINAPAQATKPELDTWLRQRQQDFLYASLKQIVTQMEQLSAKPESAVN